jgi:hypothetical protein
MKNAKEKLIDQSGVDKYSYTGNNIIKYFCLKTAAKFMTKQGIVKSISILFPTERHNTTSLGLTKF